MLLASLPRLDLDELIRERKLAEDALQLPPILPHARRVSLQGLASGEQFLALHVDGDQLILLAEAVELVFRLPQLFPHAPKLLLDVLDGLVGALHLLLGVQLPVRGGNGVGQLLGEGGVRVRGLDVQDVGESLPCHLHAGLQALHDVEGVAACRQHHDRRRPARLSSVSSGIDQHDQAVGTDDASDPAG